MSFEDFTQMPVWKLSFDLLLKIYKVTRDFSQEERFGLISDARRSANSIVHNIAEGFGRYEARDKTRFYKISRGSAYELISQILVSHALGYLQGERLKNELVETSKGVISELNAIMKTLEV
ncbi:MAG: four helix bundle protein [Thermodesulfobacteriota bacterium]